MFRWIYTFFSLSVFGKYEPPFFHGPKAQKVCIVVYDIQQRADSDCFTEPGTISSLADATVFTCSWYKHPILSYLDPTLTPTPILSQRTNGFPARIRGGKGLWRMHTLENSETTYNLFSTCISYVFLQRAAIWYTTENVEHGSRPSAALFYSIYTQASWQMSLG